MTIDCATVIIEETELEVDLRLTTTGTIVYWQMWVGNPTNTNLTFHPKITIDGQCPPGGCNPLGTTTFPANKPFGQYAVGGYTLSAGTHTICIEPTDITEQWTRVCKTVTV